MFVCLLDDIALVSRFSLSRACFEGLRDGFRTPSLSSLVSAPDDVRDSIALAWFTLHPSSACDRSRRYVLIPHVPAMVSAHPSTSTRVEFTPRVSLSFVRALSRRPRHSRDRPRILILFSRSLSTTVALFALVLRSLCAFRSTPPSVSLSLFPRLVVLHIVGLGPSLPN